MKQVRVLFGAAAAAITLGAGVCLAQDLKAHAHSREAERAWRS